jgi:hypothetical protein
MKNRGQNISKTRGDDMFNTPVVKSTHFKGCRYKLSAKGQIFTSLHTHQEALLCYFNPNGINTVAVNCLFRYYYSTSLIRYNIIFLDYLVLAYHVLL